MIHVAFLSRMRRISGWRCACVEHGIIGLESNVQSRYPVHDIGYTLLYSAFLHSLVYYLFLTLMIGLSCFLVLFFSPCHYVKMDDELACL
jgi:hypothetical protein